MNKERRNNIIEGAFVSIGMILFIVAVYFVGSKKNLFSSTFTIVAEFNDVNGLQDGDNIRFRGLDVGTIKNIVVSDDSSVIVTLMIEEKMRSFNMNSACGRS